MQRRRQVAQRDHARDVVDRPAQDGEAAVRRLERARDGLPDGQRRLERDHLRPRDHDVRGLLAGEVEDAVEHLLLGLLDQAGVLGLGDDPAQLVDGVDGRSDGRRGHAERPQQQARRALEQPDERREHALEQR